MHVDKLVWLESLGGTLPDVICLQETHTAFHSTIQQLFTNCTCLSTGRDFGEAGGLATIVAPVWHVAASTNAPCFLYTVLV